MLYIARIKDGIRWVYVVFSAASNKSRNVSIHGSFESEQKAREKFGESLEKYSFVDKDEIPARQYA